MKKKTIVELAFCVLILATIILTAAFATETYRAEKNSPTIYIGGTRRGGRGYFREHHRLLWMRPVLHGLLFSLRTKEKSQNSAGHSCKPYVAFELCLFLFGEQCVYGTAEVCVHTARSFCRLHCFENCRVVFPSEGPE